MVADGHPIIHTEADLSHNLFLLHPSIHPARLTYLALNIQPPIPRFVIRTPTIIHGVFCPCFYLTDYQIISQIHPRKTIYSSGTALHQNVGNDTVKHTSVSHQTPPPSFFFLRATHVSCYLTPPPRARSLNPVIDLCWVMLFSPPIRPLWGVMTWKWIDQLPALIPLLWPGHYGL